MKRAIPNLWAYILIVLTVILLALLFLLMVWPLNWQTTDYIAASSDVVDGYKSTNYISLMLDNSSQAMPQAGLENAIVVYEALIEGGFTRLMAVFNSADLPEAIGPIRSARPYFLDWANDWSGTYWHAGGSPQALESLKKDKWNFIDLNEISYQGIYFFRDHSFLNPHNLFTRSELITTALAKYEIDDQVDYPWDVKEDLELDYRTDGDKFIHVPYTQSANDVYWYYDKESNKYQRYIGEEQQYYTNGEVVAVKNVVVIILNTKLIDVERLGMDTITKGSGYIFRDGQSREIFWQKESVNNRLQFLSGQKPVQLNLGKTWIQILPQYLNLTYN